MLASPNDSTWIELVLPFHFPCFAGPGNFSLGKAWVDRNLTHQHPLRLRRFGSGAPGLLGRGIAGRA